MKKILIIGLFFLAACKKSNTNSPSPSLPSETPDPITVRVLALNYDAFINSNGTPKRLHEHFNWNNPRQLADQYIQDLKNSSGNVCNYVITEWRDIDGFPAKEGGFRYTPETYSQCLASIDNCYHPYVDYPLMIQEQNVIQLINNNVIDEV